MVYTLMLEAADNDYYLAAINCHERWQAAGRLKSRLKSSIETKFFLLLFKSPERLGLRPSDQALLLKFKNPPQHPSRVIEAFRLSLECINNLVSDNKLLKLNI